MRKALGARVGCGQRCALFLNLKLRETAVCVERVKDAMSSEHAECHRSDLEIDLRPDWPAAGRPLRERTIWGTRGMHLVQGGPSAERL